MKLNFRRLLAMFLSVIMVVGMMPAAVFAEDAVVETQSETYVAYIGEQGYETLAKAVAAVKDNETITISGEISEGTIKLPTTLNNVTIKGGTLKDMTITAPDGNSFSYVGLTFDGITFENSRLLFTGWRNGDEVIENFTVTNCTFKNLNDSTNNAPVHINKDASEPVNGFTFTNNVIDGATGGSKSGIYLQATGNVTITGNVINNVSFRPFVVQLTSDDGIADTFTVEGNTFSGSAAGRAQGLSNNAEGTDSVYLVVTNNIFKDIKNSQQICYWNFNAETTTANISKNYYDIDIENNPSGIYYNKSATSVEDLVDMGVFPIYKELNADGTINTESAYTPATPAVVAQVNGTDYAILADAVAAVKANGGTLTLLADAYESMTFNYPADGAPVEITIDLNGFTITSEESTLWVSDGYVVTVMDSSAAKTGKIVTTSTDDEAIAIARGGKVILNSGTVEGKGYGIYLYSGSATGGEALEMNGGTVTVPNGGTAIAIGSGKVTINAGEVLCNKTPGGGGWNTYVYANATLEITGGEFLGTIGNFGTTSISGGTFSYCEDPNDGFNNSHLASGYTTKKNDNGSITIVPIQLTTDDNGYSVVSTYEELLKALETENAKVILANDITATATQSTSYGKTGIILDAGDILDGNDHKLTINGANTDWDSAITMRGGEVKNLTIAGAMRGVFMPGANGDVVIDTCVFKDVVYTFNSDAGSKEHSVTIKNTTLNGWTSFSNVHESVTFDNCTFGEGSGYAFCRPYNDATFVECEFNSGFAIDAVRTTNPLAFNDCTYANESLSAENGSNLFAAGKVIIDGEQVSFDPVAQIGETTYTSLQAAINAAQSGDEIILLRDTAEDVTVPAGVTFNGNGKQVGVITAAGEITFKGYTKATNFGAQYINTTINIGAGACLNITGTGRMIIGYGCTFNITGTITDAKTANTEELTASLIMPGASFTGAGVTFNVTDAYIKAPSSYCSSSSSASSTFDFNITNSIIETAGKLAFEAQSTAATVNFELKDSVLTTGSHLVFGVSSGEIVIDNSNVNVGTPRQIENRSTMTIKNGSVVNGTVATSSNAINPGTIIVEDATYAVTGEFSGSDVGTGTIVIKDGASFTAGKITKANIQIDAANMFAGDVINLTADLSGLTGTVKVINNDSLVAVIVDGKIVLSEKPVAQIGETYFASLNEAIAAVKANGGTLTLLANAYESITFNYPADGAPVEITLDLNGFTITSAESTLWVSDGYIVTIKDSVGTGKIVTTSNNGGDSAEAIAVNRDGKVILEGGTVEAPYYGVFLYSGNTIDKEVFVMNGGKIEVPNGGQALSISKGKATINGGKVIINKVPNGAGWNTVVYENGVLDITGGKFFGTIGNWGTTSISGGTFSYPDDPNDGFRNEHLAAGYATMTNADGSLTVYALPTSLQGSGTEEDPYLINDIDDLKFFRYSVNNGNRYNGQFVKLNADIDLNDEEWTPIGDRNVDQGSFLGTFDGGNHTISNLWISKWNKTGAGFFSKVGNQTEYVSGTVKNLTFKNVTIISSQDYVGVIAQAPSGALIDNVRVTGDISISGHGYVGGIVGHGYPTINNSSVIGDGNGTITANYWGAGAILGFAGDHGAKINNATVEGVKIHANYGGAASVAGSPYGAAIDGANVKDVVITSNSDYCMGYVSAGGSVANVTATNVTATANGQPITPADVVATIGSNIYFSLEEALDAVQDGETVTLLKDVKLDSTITIDGTLTLDLNGHTISGECTTSQGHMFMIKNGATMTVKSGDSSEGGVITFAGNNSTGWIIDVEGALVLESGTLELTGTWNIGYAVDVRPNAWGTAYTAPTTFTMNGGKIVSSDGAVRVASSSSETYSNISASFTMNGGEIDAAWDGVFVQQSNAAWDVLNVTINGGTIKSGLNPIRFYGPAATSYVNGEDCVDITLNGGTLTYTGTETREWLVDGILRIGGDVTADDVVNGTTVTASAAFANANVADGYEWVAGANGMYELAEVESVAIVAKSATLLYEDMIQIRYKFEVTGKDIEEYGMFVFTNKADADAHDASKAVQQKELEYKVIDGSAGYFGSTDGIVAKEMGNSQFVVGYVVLNDGTTVYTDSVEYSPRIYAKRMVEKGTEETKALCNALMAYGAAAQKYLNYKTNDLMNEGFDNVAFDESVLGQSVFAVDTTETNGFTTKSATLIFEGAITYRIRYTANNSISGKNLYVEYTIKGVTGSVAMTPYSTAGNYEARIDGIAAKDMDETITIRPYYIDDDGNKVYGAELVYSGYEYSRRTIETSSNADSIDLAKNFAMYVYAANNAIK